jgi:hypothetical protein
MTDLVNNKTDFERYESMFHKLFKQGVAFKDNPFHLDFRFYVAFEFDFIYHESFFSGLKVFLGKIDNKSAIFYTVEPPAKDYFYHRYKTYSIFEISSSATDFELESLMVETPQLSSTGDCIRDSSDEIAWFSASSDWAILASRDWELGLVGFSSIEIKELFMSSFGNSMNVFMSVQRQIEIYDEMLEFTPKRRKQYNQLEDKYRDK